MKTRIYTALKGKPTGRCIAFRVLLKVAVNMAAEKAARYTKK